MIRNREKLKLAMWLLLIVRNGAFAEDQLKCYKGVQVDGNDGYNEKAVPESVGCPSGEVCLRIEIDEIRQVDTKKSQLIFFNCPNTVFTRFFKLRVNVLLRFKFANLFRSICSFHMLKVKSE